jgi:hypothetical protein
VRTGSVGRPNNIASVKMEELQQHLGFDDIQWNALRVRYSLFLLIIGLSIARLVCATRCLPLASISTQSGRLKHRQNSVWLTMRYVIFWTSIFVIFINFDMRSKRISHNSAASPVNGVSIALPSSAGATAGHTGAVSGTR